MPNMFGGDQGHPAYMPRPLDADEELVGNIHYTAGRDGRVRAESVDGRSWTPTQSDVPPKIRRYLERLADNA